jgi:hypothetical protein
MISKKEKNEKKRQRYADDPEYRAMILATNLKSRVKHREERNAKLRLRYATDPEYRANVLLAGKGRERNYRQEALARHGLTIEQYDEMLRAQGGGCFICGEPREENLCVDHSHDTQMVRGLLCLTCNLGLGHFKDDRRLTHAATHYLWRAFLEDAGAYPEQSLCWGSLRGSRAGLPTGRKREQWSCTMVESPEDREQAKRLAARARHLKIKYNMTLEDEAELKRRQGGACAICGERPDELHVDHSHVTSRVRSLLCLNCNAGIGFFRDDHNLTARATMYLRIAELLYEQTLAEESKRTDSRVETRR